MSELLVLIPVLPTVKNPNMTGVGKLQPARAFCEVRGAVDSHTYIDGTYFESVLK